jgi:hypothetical protein
MNITARGHFLRFRRSVVSTLLWGALTLLCTKVSVGMPSFNGASKVLATNPYPFIFHILLAPVGSVGPYICGALAIFYALRATKFLGRAVTTRASRLLEPR